MNSTECISVVVLDPNGKFGGIILGEVRRLPIGVTKMDIYHSRCRLFNNKMFSIVQRRAAQMTRGSTPLPINIKTQ